MPVKTAAKTAKTRTIKKSNNVESLNLPADFLEVKNEKTTAIFDSEILLSLISVSPLKSQANRRARFNPLKLEELKGSIEKYGVVNPITVRPLPDDTFQLIAGERRKLASEMAGLEKIPVVVKNLSEQEAAEIQLIENTQREDLHPADEAYAYQDMKDIFGHTDKEIALRVDKSLEYVTNRLKVLTLSPKVLELFEANELTLSHALEIAKYPAEAHESLLNYCFNNFGYESQTLRPVPKFVQQIQTHHLLQLKEASFSIKATNLRPDGLPCVKCPERTGASPLLFGQEGSGKNDSCLNRKCYAEKMKADVRLKRAAIVETNFKISDPVKIEKNLRKAPLVSDEYYVSETNKPPEPFVAQSDYKTVKTLEECGSGETGVYFNGSRVGQIVHFCRDKQCKTHKSNYYSSAAEDPEKARETRLVRKEELFDMRVAEQVRRRVLKKAAETFDGGNTIFNHLKKDVYQTMLVARLWKLQCSYSDHTAGVIREILEIEKDALSTDRWSSGSFLEQIEKLSLDVRARLLFLLLHAFESEIIDGHSFESQKPIRKIAEDFDLDYQIFDAEARLGQASMKNKDIFRAYLSQVESGDADAKVPRLWSDKWKAKD